MKKLYSILIAALLTAGVFLPQQASAQAPEKMSYQAVVRDGSNALVTSTAVGMRISILQTTPSGTAVYVETQTPTSNANGLVSLEIGSGTVVSGGFTTIDWSAGPYFIKTETDPDGGTNYTITGTSQLLSVPYALYAGNGLSTADKTKLDNLNDGAEENIQPDWEQTNDIADDFIKNKPPIPSDVNQLADMDNLLGSSSFSGSFNDLTDVPTNLDTDATDDFSGSYEDLSDQPDLSVFLTSETDPAVAANFDFSGAANGDLLQFNGTKWVKVTPNYISDYTVTESDVTAHEAALSVTESQISDLGTYIETETDPSVPTGTQTGQMQYWNGSAWITVAAGSNGQTLTFINGVPAWLGFPITADVVASHSTGKIWMDRNLGASQVATSSTDAAAYGDLYQWGRGTDGHEKRNSSTTSTLSSSDTPGHGDFIFTPNIPFDWRNPQNDNLWQGVSGTNNPCPSGLRLPTVAELDVERQSWSSNNAAGAFASPLKLPLAGLRNFSNGAVVNLGFSGSYWSSTVSTVNSESSRLLDFNSFSSAVTAGLRAYGYSVRCIKD